MAKVKNLEDLFLGELKDLYYAEKKLEKELPKMAKKANNEKLKSAFEEHHQQTQGHIERLEKVFKEIGKKPVSKKCEAIEGILKEGKEIMDDASDDKAVFDAGVISAAQKAEHYEIASYGTLVEFAKKLNYNGVTDLLTETLNEEKQTDKKLSRLATSGINKRAMTE